MAGLDENLGEVIQENVKRFRLEAGMSQQRLADESGVSVDAVRKWEGKRGIPDRESVTKLAAALGRKMDDFNLRDPPPPAVRRVPVFGLKMAPDAPPDLKKMAEDYIERLNRQAAERDVKYPEGVRQARGQSDPKVTVRPLGSSRRKGHQERQGPTEGRTSEEKRRRR